MFNETLYSVYYAFRNRPSMQDWARAWKRVKSDVFKSSIRKDGVYLVSAFGGGKMAMPEPELYKPFDCTLAFYGDFTDEAGFFNELARVVNGVCEKTGAKAIEAVVRKLDSKTGEVCRMYLE